MTGLTKREPVSKPVHWARRLREEPLVISLSHFGDSVTVYLLQTDGDYWMTTSRTAERNLTELGWTETEIIELIRKSEGVNPLSHSQAPIGDLFAHNP